MMVVAVVSILAALAFPAYTDHVQKTHRKNAIGETQDMAGRIGRIKSQTFSYASANGVSRNLDRYTITVTADAATYTITATALGSQASDVCGSFTLDHESVWTFAGGRSYDDCN